MMSEHTHAHEEHNHHASATPYVLTLAALLFLTVITVSAAYVDFGSSSINLTIAMAIATVKASLVALIFMHLRNDKPINAVIFISSLLFLGAFLLFPLIDVSSRIRVVPSGLSKDNAAAIANAPLPDIKPKASSHGAGGHAAGEQKKH